MEEKLGRPSLTLVWPPLLPFQKKIAGATVHSGKDRVACALANAYAASKEVLSASSVAVPLPTITQPIIVGLQDNVCKRLLHDKAITVPKHIQEPK